MNFAACSGADVLAARPNDLERGSCPARSPVAAGDLVPRQTRPAFWTGDGEHRPQGPRSHGANSGQQGLDIANSSQDTGSANFRRTTLGSSAHLAALEVGSGICSVRTLQLAL